MKADYQKVIEAFGGQGFLITKPDELQPILSKAFSLKVPALVNIIINPSGPTPRNVQQQK